VARHDVLVNEYGTFLEDRGAYDAENPYGPFACTQCGAEFDDLEELELIGRIAELSRRESEISSTRNIF
jgi:hypothetical protein